MTDRERGSGTALGLVSVGLLVALITVAVALGAAIVGRQRAAAGADLAALAAAQLVLQTGSDPCTEAARVAGRNGTRLTTCRVAGLVVEVEVSRPVGSWFGRDWVAHGRARAGPVEPTG